MTPTDDNVRTVDEIIAEGRARREKQARADRADFFAHWSDEVPPSLEFCTPNCPSCSQPTVADADSFYCDFCCLSWDLQGNGCEIDRRWCAEDVDHPLATSEDDE